MNIGSGIGGFIVGAAVTPVVMIGAGLGLEKGLHLIQRLSPEQQEMAHGAGAVGAAAIAATLFDSSPFLVGFKTAMVFWTAIAGAYTGCEAVIKQIKHYGLTRVLDPDFWRVHVLIAGVAALAGIIIGASAVAIIPAVPAIGLFLGGFGAYMVGRYLCEWAANSNLDSKFPGFPGLFKLPAVPEGAGDKIDAAVEEAQKQMLRF